MSSKLGGPLALSLFLVLPMSGYSQEQPTRTDDGSAQDIQTADAPNPEPGQEKVDSISDTLRAVPEAIPSAPKAENIDLKEVISDLEPADNQQPQEPEQPQDKAPKPAEASPPDPVTEEKPATPPAPAEETGTEAKPDAVASKFILGVEVPPITKTRLVWTPGKKLGGLAERTPVLVVNGANPGSTLCLTAAVHGDELNGIEMIRRVVYNLDAEKLSGTVIGVPVVNLMGFRRTSRYLPDRRDLNRYFPGNTSGSSASRIAHSFFSNVIRHCDALVDIHTGSFHRTNLLQLRADLSVDDVAKLAHQFGEIAVLNTRGNHGSLRAAATRQGIPSVTIEAGEPMRLQEDVVIQGVEAIRTLMANLGMYGSARVWFKPAPVYYKSYWVRTNQSGILFSEVELGQRVSKSQLLGTVTDPITNARSEITSPYNGRVLGMALDQVVLPGFAAYHIGIQMPEERVKEYVQLIEDDGQPLEENAVEDAAVPAQTQDSTENKDASKLRDDFEDE